MLVLTVEQLRDIVFKPHDPKGVDLAASFFPGTSFGVLTSFDADNEPCNVRPLREVMEDLKEAGLNEQQLEWLAGSIYDFSDWFFFKVHRTNDPFITKAKNGRKISDGQNFSDRNDEMPFGLQVLTEGGQKPLSPVATNLTAQIFGKKFLNKWMDQTNIPDFMSVPIVTTEAQHFDPS